MQRLQPASLNSSSYRNCGGFDRPVDRAGQCRIGFVDHDARYSAEDHLYLTLLIDASLRPVDIREPNGDPLDRRREFTQLHPQLSGDVVAVALLDRGADDANVSRR